MSGIFTVMLPMISNCRPVGPTNLHITSSTVAVCTWNRSWSFGNVDSRTLISCFNTFRQAIIVRASTLRPVDHNERSCTHYTLMDWLTDDRWLATTVAHTTCRTQLLTRSRTMSGVARWITLDIARDASKRLTIQ